MDNKVSSTSNINMRGNLVVTTWKNYFPERNGVYKTTRTQDKLIQDFLKDKVKLYEEVELSHSNSDFIHHLFELFTGKNFQYTKSKKTVYSYGDEFHISDFNFKLNDGVEFEYNCK